MQIVIDIPEHYYENNIKKELPICLTEEQVIAILPKEYKIGKPIFDIDSQDWSLDKPLKCPFCNERFGYDIHYCPNCGAKMVESEEE